MPEQPKIQFTPAQAAAISARGGSLLVSAAAGSGKTRVLVERVVGLITDPVHPVDANQLLIMTFTNAAAAKLRADMAEEKAAELDNKVKVGSVLRARDIRLSALNDRSKPVSRVKNAARLRVDFALAANELATPGNKAVYVRITSPDGYVLTTEAMPTFEFEGERLSYSAMREVDYQNQDLEVGIYYNSTGFAAGTYQIQLYCEGRLIGQTQVVMK